MDELLTVVRPGKKKTSAGKQENDDPLITVSSSRTNHRNESPGKPIVSESKLSTSENNDISAKYTQVPRRSEDVLAFLRSEPPTELLLEALDILGKQRPFPEDDFTLAAPGPTQAQIINEIVNNVLPTYWWVLKDTPRRQALISCLSNLAGFGAVIARIRFVVSQNNTAKDSANGNTQRIRELLDVAAELFEGDGVLSHVWNGLRQSSINDLKKQMAWKEYVNLTASGRAIGVVAQGEDAVKSDSGPPLTPMWISRGPEYAQWLGRNAATMIAESDASADAAAQVVSKSLSLGYQTNFVDAFFSVTVRHQFSNPTKQPLATTLNQKLPAQIGRHFLEHTLRWLSTLSLSQSSHSTKDQFTSSTKSVASIVSLLSTFDEDEKFRERIAAFLSDPALCASISLVVRRACVKILASSSIPNDDLDRLLEKLIKMFGDRIFINHSPILQQEAIAQTLLLVAGYLHRMNPMAVLMIARSSHHMQGVSNRLDTSNTRARWLGMVVGTALSSLVDKEGMKMKFEIDDMETEEAESYLGLVTIDDHVGSLRDFEQLLKHVDEAKRSKGQAPIERKLARNEMPMIDGKPTFGPIRPSQTEVIGSKVSEIFDDEDGEDGEDLDGLKPYAKPDSDAEDSDEDATLVNRNKSKAPVYIRDLMSMLRDDKDAERFQLGIKHAATLIRRKTGFGSEVKDHAEELGSILCNLQDPFSTEDFDELKLQSMIAVLLSDVKTMAPWFSQQAYIGEFSIAQRCIILSALGLGGRELAGIREEDELNPSLESADFPSKRLPSHLAAIYNSNKSDKTSARRLEAATSSMQHQLLQPMALEAADKSTAHLNAVKIRNFSSRLSQPTSTSTSTSERTKRKAPANQLAKIFSSAFFFPLANRYQQDIAAYGDTSTFSHVPTVLVTFLRTLALLLHASGPATLDLPAVTAEFWDLLLSLRTRATRDIAAMQAVLFALLTLLEVNAENHRRLVAENPRQLMQTQEWVDLVFERMGAGGAGGFVSETGGSEEEIKVRTLAAGILVKTRAAIEMYQRELVGYSFD